SPDLVLTTVVLYPTAMVADGDSTASISSRRPNLSPMASKSGPALPLVPSVVWHLAQARRCSSRKSLRPRSTSPWWVIAKDWYLSFVGGLGASAAEKHRSRITGTSQ